MGNYTFYNGNSGSGNNLGQVPDSPGANFDLSQSGAPVTNGHANSVVLSNVPANSSLVVYDQSSATLTNDSWCLITTLQDVNSHTVDSFEDDSNGQSVNVNYHHNNGNGLDGKVSAIGVYAAWPGTTPAALLTDGNASQEPSGLAIWTDSHNIAWLYQASDNGQLTRINVSTTGNSWSEPWNYATDVPNAPDAGNAKAWAFESITRVGNMLMVGVEGGEAGKNGQPGQVNPLIREFDPSDTSQSPIGSFTGNVWSLELDVTGNNKGMEAMTFVASGNCPSDWNRTNNVLGGYFLVGLQTAPGLIYAFNLPAGNGGLQTVGAVDANNYGIVASFDTGLLNLKMSDMVFANNRLWVLYDDSFDALQALQLTPSISLLTQAIPITPDGVQNSGSPTMVNCEGITFHGSTMFLALDQNDSDPNYVLQYDNFGLPGA